MSDKKKSPEAHPRRHPGAEDTDTKVRGGDEVRHLIRIRRGADVEIRLCLCEHRGHEHVDIRMWWGNDDGEWLPSRRGVTVPPRLWPEFFEGVVELDHELRATGVVESADDDD